MAVAPAAEAPSTVNGTWVTADSAPEGSTANTSTTWRPSAQAQPESHDHLPSADTAVPPSSTPFSRKPTCTAPGAAPANTTRWSITCS
ncbi:hypothetical protein ACFQ1B_27780 [Streptomyces mexicanus]